MIIPWLDQMRNCEDGAEENAHATDDDVSNAKEGIPSAHDGAGRDDD
jgi:hypothetical protein